MNTYHRRKSEIPALPIPTRISDAINLRFRTGRPSNDLNKVGVIIHLFDVREEEITPWVQEYLYGNERISHISASIIYAGLRNRKDRLGIPLSMAEGGIVIRPTETDISCAYAVDSSSIFLKPSHANHFLSGCPDIWCTPPFERKKCGFQRHRPSSGFRRNNLQDMLKLHHQYGDEWRLPGFHSGYNEVIIQNDTFTNHLPAVVEAFFYVKDCDCQFVNDVSGAHSNFLKRFGLNATDVPLLQFDPYDYHNPFKPGKFLLDAVPPADKNWINIDWG